jgi:hypothetical protein
MKFVLTLIIVLFSIFLKEQYKIEYGRVKFDSSFNCSENLKADSLYYGIRNICESDCEVEIRLQSFNRPHGGSQLVILSFNNGRWNASKYKYNRGNTGIKREVTTLEPEYERVYNFVFELTFDTLRLNNIFLLPDQKDLKLKGEILDGATYVLAYKVGNKFRSYGFNNIESFAELNPASKELKNYITIVKYLMKLFE